MKERSTESKGVFVVVVIKYKISNSVCALSSQLAIGNFDLK